MRASAFARAMPHESPCPAACSMAAWRHEWSLFRLRQTSGEERVSTNSGEDTIGPSEGPTAPGGSDEAWARLYPDLARIGEEAMPVWDALNRVLPALLGDAAASSGSTWPSIGRRLSAADRRRLVTIETRSRRVVQSLRPVDARLSSGQAPPDVLVVEIGVRETTPLSALWDALSDAAMVAAYFQGDAAHDAHTVASLATQAWRLEFNAYLRGIAQRRVAAGEADWLVAEDSDEWVPPPASNRDAPVGVAPKWLAARRTVRLAADRAAEWLERPSVSSPAPPLLLVGETGTGKELLAREAADVFRATHADARVITVNCATIPETLATSILFGHLKGSFTGANQDHHGKFVEADGGVLFLDEVHRLPLAGQRGLLRVLETGVVEVLGQGDPIALPTVRVFVIAAMNELAATGPDAGPGNERLAPDLFHRLAAAFVRVPPLRERGAHDVSLLVERFEQVEGVAPGQSFSADERELIVDYEWPGNVRELKRAVEFRSMLVRAGGAPCQLCGVRGHVHGALVRPRQRDAAVKAAKQRSRGALTNAQVGAHLGGLTKDQVKKAWTDPDAKPGRKRPPTPAQLPPCDGCRNALASKP